jgi:dienelactone hydrolase
MYGPEYIFNEIAANAPKLFGYSVCQVSYRIYGNVREATNDVISCIRHLTKNNDLPVYLIGWSMGGAVVIQAANSDCGKKCVKGVITLAGQTKGSEEISNLNVSILILHGTHDRCLWPNCADWLFKRANWPKTKILLNGSAHECNGAYDIVIEWLNNNISNTKLVAKINDDCLNDCV